MDNTGKEIIDVGKALLKDIFSQNWMEISIVCIVVLIFILITLFSIILLLISIVERNFRDITKNTVTSILKTGQSGDKACNIYDMSGNISEWTTETATNSTGKCTYIGGGIGQQQGTAFSRYVSDTVSKSNSISFRVIMYIDN